jgi:Nif-specific regulatory protein
VSALSEPAGTDAAARLDALSGPLQGRAFLLDKPETSVGRDPSNDIPILDPLVSRHHCVVRRAGSEFQIHDLDSRNCTYVNGLPLKGRALAPGDQIRVGNSVFVFHGPETGATAIRIGRGETPGGSTVVLRKEDALYLKPFSADTRLPATARTVKDLDVLLKFSLAINSISGLEALARKVIESVMEVTPADRASLLLLEEGAEEFVAVFGWDRRLGPNQPIQVSQTILGQVVGEGLAVLSNDVAGEEAFQQAESLLGPRVRSVLAAPLDLQGKLLGVLYLDAASALAQFDSNHLQLVTGLANVAAVAVENVRRMESLAVENRRLQQEINIEHSMVGDSDAMRAVYQFISRVAGTEATVLIWGESGTGKELVARAVHANSERAAKPFVAINCAAIADTLLESELFGHEKGAFTGAVSQQKGKLETANGGTVFLDEIGELALTLQSKLLRVLQEREFERVGGTRAIKLDIRLIAATNRDLKEASRTGAFRQDLYYRLNVVSVRMPALRERRPDIPLLANYFVTRFSEKVKRRITGITPRAQACLMQYGWPGNVRELENAMERAVVLGSTPAILPEDLPETILEEAQPEGQPATGLYEGLRLAKKDLIERTIEQTGGNYTEAAAVLGVHPNHLFRLIRALNLKPKRQRQE